jgi:hypothetical protein
VTNKNRKTYLKLKESLTEFFTAPVRYLKESNQKESEFEKPYLDTDYRAMHLDIPDPDWPTWKFDPYTRRQPPGEVLGTGPGCKSCDLSAWPIYNNECDTGVITFFSSSRCVLRKGMSGWGNTTLVAEALIGEITEIVPGSMAGIFPTIDVSVNPDIANHTILGTMVDDLGNVCTELVEVTCVVCPPDTAFTFDDASTSDTIAPGGNITVYVLGGSSPFSWASAGTGYSWGSGSTTTARENVLTSAAGT